MTVSRIRIHEEELQHKALVLLVPISEEPSLSLVHRMVRNLERDDLVRITGEQDVLEVFVRRLHLLLKGGHESVARLGAFHGFWIVHFEGQGALASVHVTGFSNLTRKILYYNNILTPKFKTRVSYMHTKK